MSAEPDDSDPWLHRPAADSLRNAGGGIGFDARGMVSPAAGDTIPRASNPIPPPALRSESAAGRWSQGSESSGSADIPRHGDFIERLHDACCLETFLRGQKAFGAIA